MESKSLGKLDVMLSMVCAVLFADTIISNTSMGTPVITWWIIIGIFFFIPNGFITAELAGAYPDKGGIYGWIDRAFGPVWAGRLSWIYWINCALWMPSAFIWLSGALLDAVLPNTSLWVDIIVGLIITWACVGLASLKMADSKWIINLGGICKVVIFALVILAGVFSVISGSKPANDMSAAAFTPTLGDGLMYLPVILYCCCGMEIIAGSAHEMKNPRTDLPKAAITVVLITLIGNILASFSVLRIIPLDQLNLVSGLNDVMRMAFGSVVANIGIAILLFSVFVQVVVWALGGARGAAEAGQAGELPAVFGIESTKSGTPTGALVLSGIVSSVVLVAYGFMAGSSEDLFWMLLAFSSIVFFMPYLMMFPAYIRLKKIDPNVERPFKAPLGKFCAVLCEIILAAGVILFIWAPGMSFVQDSLPILIGVIVTLVVGEVIIQVQRRRNCG